MILGQKNALRARVGKSSLYHTKITYHWVVVRRILRSARAVPGASIGEEEDRSRGAAASRESDEEEAAAIIKKMLKNALRVRVVNLALRVLAHLGHEVAFAGGWRRKRRHGVVLTANS